jgi:sulfite exporter TauE/SafE
MCGGIVTALAVAGGEKSAAERLFFAAAYHSGRVLTYVLLGVVLGLAAQMALLTPFKPHLRWIFLTANLVVIATGLATALNLQRFNLFSLDGSGSTLFSRPLRWAVGGHNPLIGLPLGMVLGLLPCGPLYAVLATAASSGSAFSGGSIMLAFGLGTTPALLAVGGGAAWLRSFGGMALIRIMGTAVALLGMAGLWRVLGKMGYLPPPPFI